MPKFTLAWPARPTLLALLPLLPLSALAQQALPPVQIQGRSDGALSEDSALKRVVGAAELTRMNDARLVDALARLSGLSVEPGRPGQGDQLSLRGLGAGRTQLLLNGRRVPPGFSLDSLSPEQIARVEILTGHSAGLSGEAVAGSINIVLKPAAQQRLRRWQAGAAVLGGQGGGQQQRLQLQQGDALALPGWPGWSEGLTLTASERRWWQDERDDSQSPQARRLGQQAIQGRQRQLQLAPQLGWAAPGGQQLDWSNQLDWQRFERGVAHEIQTLSGPSPAWPSHAERYAQQRLSWRSELEGHWLPAPGWQLQAGVQAAGLTQRSHFSDQGPASALAQALDDLTLGRLREQGQQASASLAWDGLARHSLTLGWSASRQQRREWRAQHLAGEPVSDLALRARQTRQAWSLQDDWELSPAHQLSLGWRQEGLTLDSEGLSQRLHLGLPSLQWLWRLPQGQWRSALSRSFRAPTLAQLQPRPFTSANNSALDPDQQGNPALRPERAWALDLQWQARLGAGRRFSLGGSLRRIQDAMLQASAYRLNALGQTRWVRSPINAPLAWAGGLELEWQQPLPAGLSLQAQLSRQWSRVQGLGEAGLQLAEQRPLQGQLSLQGPLGRMPAAHWRLAYAWRPGDWRHSAPGERIGLPAAHRLDLMLQRPLGAGWTASVHAEGLLQPRPVTHSALWLQGQAHEESAQGAAPWTLRLALQGRF